jgi:hypothetical protein
MTASTIATISPAYNPDFYKPYAALALTIGTRMTAWLAEAEQLAAITDRTPEQEERIQTLAASLDTYAVAIEDVEMPKEETWVTRALKTQVVA